MIKHVGELDLSFIKEGRIGPPKKVSTEALKEALRQNNSMLHVVRRGNMLSVHPDSAAMFHAGVRLGRHFFTCKEVSGEGLFTKKLTLDQAEELRFVAHGQPTGEGPNLREEEDEEF